MHHGPARPTNETVTGTVRRSMLAVVTLKHDMKLPLNMISKSQFAKFLFILKVLASLDFRGFVR